MYIYYFISIIIILSIIKINEILNFWLLNESYWFNTKTDTIDRIITQKYKFYLILAEYKIISFWKLLPNGDIVLIIILDQFSRHIYRSNKQKIMNNTQKAYYISRKIIESNDIFTKYSNINLAMWVLMPLRHLSKIEYLNECNKILINLQHNINKNNKLWDKVYRANNLRLEKEKRENQFTSDSIIDYSTILENPWMKNTSLCKQDSFNNLSLIKKTQNILKKYVNKNTCIIVSLSGGVDSMVLLRIILEIYKYNPIIACHINYNIRSESDKEEEFLNDYSNLLKKQYTNLNFFVKKISKFTQNWQEETRNIRFDFYKELGSKYDNYIVLTGHIFDDLIENVLLNIFQGGTKSGGTNILSITGMKENSLVRGVNLIRPLLFTDKNQVIHLAKLYDIPYFNDSSFILATRIRIRKELLPLLKEIFSSSETRLKQITNSSIEINDILVNKIINPVLKNNLKYDNKNWVLDITNLIDIHQNIFWNSIFSEILLSNKYVSNTYMISHKSINSFIMTLSSIDHKKNNYKKSVIKKKGLIDIILEKKDVYYFLTFNIF